MYLFAEINDISHTAKNDVSTLGKHFQTSKLLFQEQIWKENEIVTFSWFRNC